MQIVELFAVVMPQVHLDTGLSLHLLLLRWIHILAGITWIGLLYFLKLVNAPLLQQSTAEQRAFIVTRVMPRTLWWFRWSSVVTVFIGILYWMHTVGGDAQNAGVSGGHAIGTFFGIWTAVFVIEMAILMSPAGQILRGAGFALLMAILVVAAGYFYVALNQHAWESNRLVAIGIGGGLGWVMMLNLWGIFWRMQKKIIRWTEAHAGDPMPPEIARVARIAALTAGANFYLSFPMLLFMAIAPHYHMFINVE